MKRCWLRGVCALLCAAAVAASGCPVLAAGADQAADFKIVVDDGEADRPSRRRDPASSRAESAPDPAPDERADGPEDRAAQADRPADPEAPPPEQSGPFLLFTLLSLVISAALAGLISLCVGIFHKKTV